MTTPAATLSLNAKVLAKLQVESLTIDSPWCEIKACLSQVIAPSLCIRQAAALRNERQNPMNSYEVLIDVNDSYKDGTPYQFVFTASVKAVNLVGAIEEALTLAADTYGKANVGEAYEAREVIKTS